MNVRSKMLRIFETGASPIFSFFNLLEHRLSSRVSYIYERPIEYAFALNCLIDGEKKKVLDVGTGRSAFPATLQNCGFDVDCVDKKTGYWSLFFNQHVHVKAVDVTKDTASEKYDAITCISVLEHIPAFNEAMDGLCRRLKPGGYLILSFPYSSDEFVDNVYQLSQADASSKKAKYIAHSFSEKEISTWIKSFNLLEVRREFFQGWTGKFWKTGQRLAYPKRLLTHESANGLCICFKIQG